MIEFQELLEHIHDFPLVTDDSREVIAGAIFVYGGGRDRKDKFLQNAIEAGAFVVVSEVAIDGLDARKIVLVEDRKRASMELARAFYGDPSLDLMVIGITGTCGKTSTSYLLESVLTEAGFNVGVIGTENIRYAGEVFRSENTTPSAFALQKALRSMVVAGCSAAVMEVSSHAISQGRVDGIAFDGVMFTNLSHDHLDYHSGMDSYFAQKSRLFTEHLAYSVSRGKSPVAAINADDGYGLRLLETLRLPGGLPTERVAGFSLSVAAAEFDGSELASSPAGIQGAAVCRNTESNEMIRIESRLLGRFNVQNILGAVALCHLIGIEVPGIERGVSTCRAVPGRFQQILIPGGPVVVVDFAHKPDALDNVLTALRELTVGKLICVFGCGGARDRSKRPIMGEIAERLADVVVITSDNSRGETFEQISNDIGGGMVKRADVSRMEDRSAAIYFAISLARAGDIVLIAGRGTEQYLNVLCSDGELRDIPFDDTIVAMDAAAEMARQVV